MAKKRKKAEANHSTDFASAFLSNLFLYIRNYSEPHSQNRIFDASILLMWLPRHIKLLFCLNASIHRKQFCMALNSYIFFSLQLLQKHHTALWCMVLWMSRSLQKSGGKAKKLFAIIGQ